MKELATVIGLVFQLAAAFLLSARGFTAGFLSRIWLAESPWWIALLPGVLSTSALITSGLIDFSHRARIISLFVGSLVCAALWIPILAKHSLSFVDRVDKRITDVDIQRLSYHGCVLLAIGFVLSALGGVM